MHFLRLLLIFQKFPFLIIICAVFLQFLADFRHILYLIKGSNPYLSLLHCGFFIAIFFDSALRQWKNFICISLALQCSARDKTFIKINEIEGQYFGTKVTQCEYFYFGNIELGIVS